MGNRRQCSGQPALFDSGQPTWWELAAESRRELVLTLARLLLDCTRVPAVSAEEEAASDERED